MSEYLHPLDAGLMEIKAELSLLPFPPAGWRVTQPWGFGYVLAHTNGLRAIIDCSQKMDDRWWVHVSVSRASRTPSYEDMAHAKADFLGSRYAYSVWAPEDTHVNIHAHCLHLWALVDKDRGQALPEFSAVLPGIGRSI
jgi:hypothetical protein